MMTNLESCLVCNQRQGQLTKLIRHWDNKDVMFAYAHAMCTLFFNGSDWIFDGRQYIIRNESLFQTQCSTCAICKLNLYQKVIKCYDPNCVVSFHIGCVLSKQLFIFENRVHHYVLSRFMVFCETHLSQGLEMEHRGFAARLNFTNIDNQILNILNDHLMHKQIQVTQFVRPETINKSNKKHQKERKSMREHRSHRSHRDSSKQDESRDRKRDSRERERRVSDSQRYHRKESSRHNKQKKRRHDSHSPKEKKHSKHDSSRSKWVNKMQSNSSDGYSQLNFSSSEDSTHPKIKKEDLDIVSKILETSYQPTIIKQNPIHLNNDNDYVYLIKKKIKNTPQNTETQQTDQQPTQKQEVYDLQKTNVINEDVIQYRTILQELFSSDTYINKDNKNSQQISIRKKRSVLPLNKNDIFNMIEVINGYVPLYPANIKDEKQDIYINAWWECVSMLFYSNKEEMTQQQKTIIHESSVKVQEKLWYQDQLDQNLFNLSQQSDCFEPLIFTHYSIKDSVNVLYSTDQFQRYINIPPQNISLCRYSFEPQALKRYERCICYIGPIRIISHNQQIPKSQDSHPTKYKEHYGLELKMIEQIPLTQEQYTEYMSLQDLIDKSRLKLNASTQDDEFNGQDAGELDICYHVLQLQLQNKVDENNSIKLKIKQSMQIPDPDINKLKKEQNNTMDMLRWLNVLKSMSSGYSNKTDEVLTCFYRLPINQVISLSDRQKGLIKMQNLLSRQNNKPLDTDCKICFNNDSSDINPVIYCDKCQTSFHRLCYGIPVLFSESLDFLCDCCKVLEKTTIKSDIKQSYKPLKSACQICGKLGLPLKFMKNKFYHVACLILTNLVIFENGSLALRNTVTTATIQMMVEENESIMSPCSICGQTKGYKFQCSYGSSGIPCRHSFHPMCAYLNGIKINIQTTEYQSNSFSRIQVKIGCALHMDENNDNLLLQVYYRLSKLKYILTSFLYKIRRFGINLDNTAKLGGFQSFLEKYKEQQGYSYLMTKIPHRKIKKNQNPSISLGTDNQSISQGQNADGPVYEFLVKLTSDSEIT